MVSWAIAFFVIAFMAAVFGCFGPAASAAGLAKIIFVVAFILALVSILARSRSAGGTRL
jgi:uncharacterized membrane protein YtjA (UPF0391 family)